MSETKQEEKDWRFYPRPEAIEKLLKSFRPGNDPESRQLAQSGLRPGAKPSGARTCR